MGRCVIIEQTDPWPTVEPGNSDTAAAPLPAGQFRQEKATRHYMLSDCDSLRARASVWIGTGLHHDGREAVALGHYAAHDAESGRALLEDICQQLTEQGHALVLGPMDGNTWRRYRFIVERGDEPAFFLEPDHPPDWPAHFEAAGFTSVAHYSSALVEDLAHADPRLERVARRLKALGVTIRPIDLACFEAELTAIHELCLTAFAHNYLYTPIDRLAFLRMYLPIREFVRAELVLIAERAGKPVGFVFAVPDVAQAQRGESASRVIVKTVAILPERAYAGLGGLLVHRAHEAAARLGFGRAIHALMHEANTSRGISARYGWVFRRYALLGRELRR